MKIVAKTLYGLEKVLAEELVTLGAGEIHALNRAVSFSGDKELLYRANYCLRTALSLLVHVAGFRIRTAKDLYNAGYKIEWDRFLDTGDTFSVVPVINSKIFTHTSYPALVLKDAVADYFKNRTGRRPSVNSADPGIIINLHISNDSVTVSLDSSAIPLYRRGYRQKQTQAPLNEILAAGIILLSGWDAGTSLTDPMCGSGTIPIEAGLIACRVPPGKFREFFGFQRWKDYDPELFRSVKLKSEGEIRLSPVRICGSDISGKVVEQAKANVSAAGLENSVLLDVADFRDLEPNDENGFIFINPPYGQRLQPERLEELYGMIGTTLKHNFHGNTVWIITSGKDLINKIGLKHGERHTLFNGPIECTLLKYEMYRGTRKKDKS
jgi:putative N6-adenine-specific DNA methylase